MIDAKPFAECVSIGDDNHIKIGGIVFPSRYTKDSISQDAEYINAAVARARREAAAEALEEAAKKWPKGRGKFDSGDFGLWLEAEASALRKGDG